MPSNSAPAALTDEAIDGLLDLATDYVAKGLGDFAYATTELPSFVADTGPVVAAAQPLRQITRAACRSYARGFGPQNLPGFDAVWGGVCGPYLDSIGESPIPGSILPPFTGGQCPGVAYRVAREVFSVTNQAWAVTAFANQVYGPIKSRRVISTGASSSRWEIVHRNQANTLDVTQTFNQNVPVERIRWGAIERPDGLPDNCGNTSPFYTPPRPKPGLPVLPPQPIDFPGIGPINVNVDFGPSGEVNIELPDVGVEVTLPDPFGGPGGGPDDDTGGDGDGGDGGGAPPGDVGAPGSPAPTGPGGDVSGEAPDGSELTGLRVDISALPENPNRYTPEVYRGVCYIYMGTAAGLDHDPAGAMLRSGQFVFAEREGLTSWRVRANSTYSLVVTPYYRSVG